MSTPPDTEIPVTAALNELLDHLKEKERTGGVNHATIKYRVLKMQKQISELEQARLAELSSTLEEKLRAVSDEMSETDYVTLSSASYEFDAGFTAGLRVALNEIAQLTLQSIKNPDE